MTTRISGIGVVVPANNEEELLEPALAALVAARELMRDVQSEGAPWVRLLLVLDRCTDNSAVISSRWPDVEVLHVDHGAVGAARRDGVQYLLSSSGARSSEVWIANTDADSQVPVNWLTHQWGLALAGEKLMIGTVRPDFADLSAAQREKWLATHTPGEANGHVHGANLGFRADSYLAAGGYLPIPEHEDVRLVEALTANGTPSVATDNCCVLTSGRAYGRTPGGYASHLRERL